MLGVCYMVHGDDVGLRLPPRIAPIQVVIVTIPNSKLSEEKAQMLKGMFFVSRHKNRDFVFARLFLVPTLLPCVCDFIRVVDALFIKSRRLKIRITPLPIVHRSYRWVIMAWSRHFFFHFFLLVFFSLSHSLTHSRFQNQTQIMLKRSGNLSRIARMSASRRIPETTTRRDGSIRTGRLKAFRFVSSLDRGIWTTKRAF